MSKNKKALVLMNMGGPRDKSELEMFLKNMFNDKNIITINSNFLRSLLAKFIVSSRLDAAWKNYEQIGGCSPINPITSSLVQKLNKELEDIDVMQVMRYTPPLANQCCEQLKDKGIEELILFPLYAQYSTTTTKSSIEDFMNAKSFDFKTRIIEPFYKNEMFNKIIVNDIKNASLNKESINLIFSAHGLPVKIVEAGDPYQKQIIEHVEILTKMLKESGLEYESINLAYQSKVGPLKWLEPSLDNKLKEFKDKNILIYPIAFIIDNSETTFELDIEYREIAQELGVKEYNVCKCVNDSVEFISFIKELIKD